MSSSVLDESLIPVDVRVDDEMIRVRFNGGSEIATPVKRFPRLSNAPADKRQRWQLIGRGDGIHWPDADEDISVRGLLSLSRPNTKSSVEPIEMIPLLISDLLRTTAKLNALFPGRPFTPDGHLVGSIGEVVAEYIYDLKLEQCSRPQVDAITRDSKATTVQVKLTGHKGSSFRVRWSSKMKSTPPAVLICMKLTSQGFSEIYNGPFPLDLVEGRPESSNGQIPISLKALESRNVGLLPKHRSFASINQWFHSELADVA